MLFSYLVSETGSGSCRPATGTGPFPLCGNCEEVRQHSLCRRMSRLRCATIYRVDLPMLTATMENTELTSLCRLSMLRRCDKQGPQTYWPHHMMEQGCFIVGVQEARFSSTASFSLKHYRVVTSACTQKGQDGCALLIAQGRPYGNCQRQAPIPAISAHTHTIAEPDLLLVRIQAPGLHLLCCNAHAPHAKTEEAKRVVWWSRLREIFSDASLVKGGTPVLLMDANARMGQKTSELVGIHGAETSQMPIRIFFSHFWKNITSACRPQRRATKAALILGSAQQATQPGLTMLRSPLRQRGRLPARGPSKFLFLGNTMTTFASAVSLAYTKTLPRSGRRSPTLGRIPQAAPCRFESKLRGISPTLWAVNLDTHADTLGKQLTSALQPLCADFKRTPREPYVTPAILSIVERKKEVRYLLRQTGAKEDVLQSYRAISKQLRAALRQAKNDYLHALAAQLEQAGHVANTKWLYDALRPFRSTSSKGRRLKPLACIKSGGKPAADPEEACQVWEGHFGAIEGGVVQTPAALVSQHRQAVCQGDTSDDFSQHP